MFLKQQKRSLAFLLALILLLSTFMSSAVFPASAAEADVADVAAVSVTVCNNENATIKVNDTTLIDDEKVFTGNSLTLEAIPEEDYRFLAWINPDTGEEISADNPATLSPASSMKVAPLLYETDATENNYGVKIPAYTNEAVFDSLYDSISFFNNTPNKVITVLKNVEYEENCDIPDGTTLLIPFDDAHTVYRETPSVIQTHTTPSAHVIFTMKNGSSLTVAEGGAISVGSQLCAVGQFDGWNGAPTGPDGRICMENESTITVEDGGSLYAWGYIYRAGSGSEGSVIAESGATVYEAFQVKNWRGGSATVEVVKQAFPFNQYYIQNIEVPMTVKYGAREIGLGAVNAGGSVFPCSVTFIGADGLFSLQNERGYVIKDYLEESDRLDLQIYGDSQLSSMSLTLYDNTLDTSKYPLPITNNITVEVKEGNTDIQQDISLLPGTQLVVDQHAEMTIEEGTSVYVYDADQWNGQGYVSTSSSTNYIPIGYTAANGETNVRTNADIVDAKVDINGEVVVNGGFYCTDKADISSSKETGSITYSTTASSSSSLEECQNNNHDTVTVQYNAAQLKKPDGTYAVPTNEYGGFVTGEYTYANNDLSFEQMYFVTWLQSEGGVTLYSASYKTGETPVYGGETPTHADTNQYVFGTFTGWATAPNSGTAAYQNDNLPDVGTEDVSYYAVYDRTEKTYTVNWVDKDNNVYATENNVLYSAIEPGSRPAPAVADSYSGDYNPSSDAYKMNEYKNRYQGKAVKTVSSFTKWTEAYTYNESTGENICTLKPVYATQKQYLVLFADGNGTDAHILDAQYFTESQKIKLCDNYQGATPVKDPDAEYTYSFSGWKNASGTDYPNNGNKTYSVTNPTSSRSNSNKNTFYPTFTQTKIEHKHSLSLNGSINVNFYPYLPEGFTIEDVTADFSWGDKFIGKNQYDTNTPNTVTGVHAVDSENGMKFSLPLAAKELNDVITVTYRCGDETVTETYRGTDYAYELLALSDDELSAYCKPSQTPAQLKELLRTMLINAANAQTYFHYNTGDLATYRFEELHISPELTDVTVPAEKIKYPADDAFSGVTFYGSALNLEDETGYTLYFIINDPATYSVRKIGDVSATTTDVKGNIKNLHLDDELGVLCLSGNKKLRIKLDGLAAAEITNDIQLTYKGKTITVNPAEYIDLALNNGSDELKATVTALYHYNQAAIAFFGAEVTNG